MDGKRPVLSSNVQASWYFSLKLRRSLLKTANLLLTNPKIAISILDRNQDTECVIRSRT
ncbi:MAG TPA: hypothetical protein VK133_03605 [Amoebophilaceae bacterium]|nr:hypothetical protein [Amoebophilaceae bacterium]